MFAKSYPKVSLQSRLSRERYEAKFGMDEWARNNYGVTLNIISSEQEFEPSEKDTRPLEILK